MVEDYGTESTSQPDDLMEAGSQVLEKYSAWDYFGDGMENYTVALKKEMQQSMIDIGVETREVFRTVALPAGVVLMMVV
jgi:hypothetical protein